MWPIVEEVAAQRKSKYRDKGVKELKPVNITKEIYKKYLMEEVC